MREPGAARAITRRRVRGQSGQTRGRRSPRRSGGHGDRAQRRHRRDRGNEDQSSCVPALQRHHLYEALDFTNPGLLTSEGETVSIGIGLPMFIRGMSETVKAKIPLGLFGVKTSSRRHRRHQ